MAISIGGVLFEVGMNTNGYQAGAKRIEQIDMNLKNAIKRNHFETAQMAKDLHIKIVEDGLKVLVKKRF